MIKILKRMRRLEWTLILISMVLVFFQVWMDLKVPGYMSTITQLVISEGSVMNEILAAGGMMLLCAVGAMLLTIVSNFVSSRLAATFSRHLRTDIFRKVQSFSLEEIDRFSTASLITRSTNDVAQIQMFVAGGLTMIVRAPITVGIALSKIAGNHWQWTTLTSIAVLVVLGMLVFVVTYAHPRFRRMQILTDEVNKVTSESLTGIRVIRAYNAEEYQENKFATANSNLTNNQRQARHAMSIMRPTMRFLNNGLTIGIYLFGAFIIAKEIGTPNAVVTFSDMIVFSTYAGRILFAFMSLDMIFNQIPRVSVCSTRINEVLDTQPTIRDGMEQEGVSGETGTVEFRNVSFRYPESENDIISNISFTAKKGDIVAFIGATGSGKTTLINLVPRFYDATSGEVLIDGKNVREYSQEALHNKIGYAPQRAVLFTGTVYSNVNYGKGTYEYTEEEAREEVKKAVNIAQATDFVEAMDGGYDAYISRGGTNVSGGQKQRLSIARSVFRKPEIYIFDDTFSALDYKTDRTLRSRLREETAGVTTLIVAQRIGTIRDADKIIVLDQGEIVGMGTHTELLNSCSVYQEIAYTQLSKEELANG